MSEIDLSDSDLIEDEREHYLSLDETFCDCKDCICEDIEDCLNLDEICSCCVSKEYFNNGDPLIYHD